MTRVESAPGSWVLAVAGVWVSLPLTTCGRVRMRLTPAAAGSSGWECSSSSGPEGDGAVTPDPDWDWREVARHWHCYCSLHDGHSALYVEEGQANHTHDSKSIFIGQMFWMSCFSKFTKFLFHLFTILLTEGIRIFYSSTGHTHCSSRQASIINNNNLLQRHFRIWILELHPK